MRAVQVTVEAEHLLAALRDLAVRDERQALLRVDPDKATLSILDETPDSLCKLTLPLRDASGEGAAFSCRIQLHKWEPLTKLLDGAAGELYLTFRKTTLSVNLPGKQSVVIPNHPTAAPASAWEEQLRLAKGEFDPARITRFTIPDIAPLRDTLATCTENALLVRAGQGSVLLHTEEYQADVRTPAETLWPRDILLRRLALLPDGTRLIARIIGGETPMIVLTSVGAPVVSEILFRPYPSTRPTLTHMPLRNERTERQDRPERSERTERTERKREKAVAPEEPLIVEVVPAERLPVAEEAPAAPEGETSPPTRDEILAHLDALPGLTRIKKQIRDIAQFAAFEKERMEVLGIPGKRPTLHMAFLGNPGTGKTMVARMLGKMFKELGLLTRGHIVEVDRQKLVGAYMGHTEANLTKFVKRAQGGILFIDEAYALYKKDSAKDFGNTAIHGLVKAMEDHRDNLVVILAGYKREMQEFFSFNPGFRARVPFHLEFPDYSREELLEIADYIAAQDHYQLTPDARDALIRAALREKIDDTFGNARTIRNLLEKAKIRHAVHVSAAEGETHPDAYTQLTAQDFGDEEHGDTLEDVLAELDALVGLSEVKAMVRQMIDVLSLEQKRLVHGLEDQPLTLHMSFTGNPGTGKTTVARLIGRLMRALNLLPRGHFVEASRKDLVAGYMGQTALKTGEKIKEALGGVLFIDEAYALARRNREEFGAEALATLIKEMEDQKGLLAVILAGYTKEMANLFQLNPGLKSRVRFHLHFPDYTATELVEIVKRKAVSAHYRLTPEAEERLWQVFLRACLQADEEFGNGRLAEQVFERARIRLSTRIGRMEEEADVETLMTITEEDIEE